MAVFDSKMCDIHAPVPSSSEAGELYASYGEYLIPALAANAGVYNLCVLPAEHVPVDAIVGWAALGTGAKGSIGLTEDTGGTTEDPDAVAADTVGVLAAAGMTRVVNPDFFKIAPVARSRKFGVTLTAATVDAGKVWMTLFYRAKQSYQEIV